MELLIEIGVEELPAAPFLKEFENMSQKWSSVLSEFDINGSCEIKFTPRRIVICGNLPEFQPDSIQKFIGAPKSVAIQNGEFTKAALSFAQKASIESQDLAFANIDGKDVLYFEKLVKGVAVREILPHIINKFVKLLNFGKSMRWGSGEFEFIRPIRSVFCIFGDVAIDFEVMGVRSFLGFFPHRSFGYDLITFSTACEYFEKLKLFGVVLDQNDRRKIILDGFTKIESDSGLKIEIDNELLDEVVAITEYPVPLLGEFEERFLSVPSEIIITSMKENQRYFPVLKNGKLSNKFVVVSNSISNDYSVIVNGNERVLRARLSDAEFFWESDLKAEFGPEKLKNITYLKELGTVYDKTLRELKIALILAEIYKSELEKSVGFNYKDELTQAVMLSKADLTTGVVYEFTDLQGIMGAYYAKHKGKSDFVSNAIKEQYLPKGSEYPNGIFSSIVSMATKFDTLMGLFSIGKLPTGNKDPYALRRAASGIIKIALNLNLSFNIAEILDKISNEYAKFDLNLLKNFFDDRLFANYDINPSIIKACLNSQNFDLKNINNAILALDKISKSPEFRDNFSTFKRIANIVKGDIGEVKHELFEFDAERNLWNKFISLKLDQTNPQEYLDSLFALKIEIDDFFDNVMINVDDEKMKLNRMAIVGGIYKAFLEVADIKEISVN